MYEKIRNIYLFMHEKTAKYSRKTAKYLRKILRNIHDKSKIFEKKISRIFSEKIQKKKKYFENFPKIEGR